MRVLSRLPDDLWPLVLQHWAATVLQVHLTRWHRYRHVRRRLWGRVRALLPRHVHAVLVRHAGVRHEWFREPSSWILQSDEDLRMILAEVNAGVWGKPVAV